MKLNTPKLTKTLMGAVMVLTFSHCLFDTTEEPDDSLVSSVATTESSQVVLSMSSAVAVSSVAQVEVSSIVNTTPVSSQELLVSNVSEVASVSSQDLISSAVSSSSEMPVSSMVTVAVTGLTLNKNTADLSIGATEQLVSAIEPLDATHQGVVWTSGDETIATVTTDGLITAVASGIAVITVTANDGHFSATCTVTVPVPPVIVTGVSMNLSASSAEVGETKQLVAIIAPAEATNMNMTWSTSDETKATVSESGLVTAVAEGQPVITATTEDGSFTAMFTYHISPATVSVTGVTVNKATTTIDAGLTEQLTATIAPANATNSTITWASSDETKVTVSADGLVTAVAPGTAVITATTEQGSFTVICAVTVVAELILYAIDSEDDGFTGGNIGGRIGADNLCAANKPAGVTQTTIHAMITVNAADNIALMPANYGFSAEAVINAVDGTLLGNSFAQIIDQDWQDPTTQWQVDPFNGDLAAKLGTNAMYALVGGDDFVNMVDATGGGNCSEFTSNADVGYGGIDLSSGNLMIEAGSYSCDPGAMWYQQYAILCLAY
ncbi:MAG: Ig-like domain-containing protein [Fibrobacterales bacterium]